MPTPPSTARPSPVPGSALTGQAGDGVVDPIRNTRASSATSQEEMTSSPENNLGTDELVDAALKLDLERAERLTRPWYRRPSPWWYLVCTLFSMIAFAATMAPKIEIFTELICNAQSSDDDQPWDPERTGSLRALASPIPCAQNPRVQAAVAALMTIMSTTVGILGCLTTGYWGSLSDRRGRVFVMRINCLSLILGDILFLCVVLYPKSVPGGYYALLLGPVLEGLVGGRMTSSAAIHAYLSDVSSSASRSRVFSEFMGVIFIGMAVGPALGSLITHWTSQAIVVFYFTTAVHAVLVAVNWFLIPESLLSTQMHTMRRVYMETRAAQRTERGVLARIKSTFSFLTPLAVFLPHKTATLPDKDKGRRDWSLTLLAVSFALETLLIGSYTVVSQYAVTVYNWSSEMLGYFISLAGFTRAIFLAVILPAILTLVKRRSRQAIALPISPSEPLSGTSDLERDGPAVRDTPTQDKKHHGPALELAVARISLVALLAATLVQSSGPPAWGFVAAAVITSCSAGFSPMMQSLAMEIFMAQGGTEAGKLFGALSVLSSIASAIIGPSLYGLIFIRTIATLPSAIFILSFAVVCVSFVLLMLVRLPHSLSIESIPSLSRVDPAGLEQEETLVPVLSVEPANDEQVQL